jgi:hypothetical protein
MTPDSSTKQYTAYLVYDDSDCAPSLDALAFAVTLGLLLSFLPFCKRRLFPRSTRALALPVDGVAGSFLNMMRFGYSLPCKK